MIGKNIKSLRKTHDLIQPEFARIRGVNLLSRLYRYQDSQGISIDDESNPWILMSDDLSDLIHTNIYLVENFDEIERYSDYFDGIERMLEISEKRMVA